MCGFGHRIRRLRLDGRPNRQDLCGFTKNRLCVDGALEGEHTFTKTGRQRRASYATICQWIVDAWADISVSTVVRAFTKAGIITELPGNSSDTDSDNDERDPGMLDAVLAQLFNSDTQEFEGFVDGE